LVNNLKINPNKDPISPVQVLQAPIEEIKEGKKEHRKLREELIK
jgi:hypothetical protein